MTSVVQILFCHLKVAADWVWCLPENRKKKSYYFQLGYRNQHIINSFSQSINLGEMIDISTQTFVQ